MEPAGPWGGAEPEWPLAVWPRVGLLGSGAPAGPLGGVEPNALIISNIQISIPLVLRG